MYDAKTNLSPFLIELIKTEYVLSCGAVRDCLAHL